MLKTAASIPAKRRRTHAAPPQLCSPAQARALLQPLRVELLRLLAEPRGIRELAEALGITPQKTHYHVKALEAAGLVSRVSERRVRALTEAVYQAAESFGPSPELLGMLGGRRPARDTLSKGYLLALAEDLVTDAAQLALSRESEGREHPTLSVTAQVQLADPARRAAFLSEVSTALQAIAARYGGEAGGAQSELYKLVLACYPAPDGSQQNDGEGAGGG
jgi:DNA-binding transcriptional ArsR family regulator